MTSGSLARLRETLSWVVGRVPFYRHRLEAAGVRPETVDAESYPAVPVLRKADLVASQRAEPPFGELLAVGREEFASLHTSPGPIFIPRIAAERGGTPALVEEIGAMGVRRGDVAHVTLSYHIMPGGLRIHRAFEESGCLVINGGVGNTEMQVQVARAWGATVYAGTPSFLRQIGLVARDSGIDLRREMPYRVGFSTAERLTPELRSELSDMFGIDMFDHIGEAQIGPVAGECRAHRGMHLSANDLFFEFRDPTSGEPARPGGVGELIATHLGPRALPLVRYAPGDAYTLLEGDCPCGNPAPRVEFFGQVGAIRKVKGVLVHPVAIADVLGRFPEAGRFQLVVEHPPGGSFDRATLRVGVADPDLPGTAQGRALGERIAAAAKGAILISVEVAIVAEAEIPENAAGPAFAAAIDDRRGH
jgi:phenylacetate-coenzyme A ligase PaaK-like adenylate-forming protein